MGWFQRWLGHKRQPIRNEVRNRDRGLRSALEVLEDRVVPSTISWTNRGDDGFEIYGDNANLARRIVDRAIYDWEQVIRNFNYNVDLPVADDNTYYVEIDAEVMDSTLRGQAWALPDPLTPGTPRFGFVTLDNDAAGGGWYFDPRIGRWYVTPSNVSVFIPDDSEFSEWRTPFAGDAPGGSAANGGADFYRTILHELGHALGVSGWPYLSTTNTGFQDPLSAGNFLHTLEDEDGSIIATFTDAGGYHLYEGSNTDPPGVTTHPNDLMNSGRTVGGGRRQLVSDLNARILETGFGYSITTPSRLNTFYANFNTITGELLVRTDPDDSADFIRIEEFADGLTVVQVNETSEWFPTSWITSIVVQAGDGDDRVFIDLPTLNTNVSVLLGDGNDTVRVEGLARRATLTLDGGGDEDRFVLGKLSETSTGSLLDPIQGAVDVIGGSGDDTLIIEDHAARANDDFTYTIDRNTVRRHQHRASITYSSIDSLRLDASRGDNVINLEGSTSNILIHGREGVDEIKVTPTSRLLSRVGDGTIEFTDVDLVSFDNRNEDSHTYSSLHTGDDGRTEFALRYFFGDEFGYPTYLIEGRARVILQSGGSHDEIWIDRMGTFHSWSIHGNGGNDSLYLSNTTGRVRDFPGGLTFDGGTGADSVGLVDSDAASGGEYYVERDRVYSNYFSPWIVHSRVEEVSLVTSVYDDSIFVRSTQNGTELTLESRGGDDTVTVGGGDYASNIGGRVTLYLGSGFNDLIIDDSGATAFRHHALAHQSYVSQRKNDRRLEFERAGAVTLNAGSGGDTIVVQEARVPTTINAGAGNDTIDLGPTLRDLGAWGNLTLNPGSGNRDHVIIHDENNPYNGGQFNGLYDIDTTGVRRYLEAFHPGGFSIPLPVEVRTNGAELVTLHAGELDDVINVDRSGVTVLAGNGNDSVHLSRSSGNLLSTSSVSVFGEGGDDRLFLHDQNNPDPLLMPPEVYTITETSLSRQQSVPAPVNQIPVAISFPRIENLTLYSAPGFNIFNITGTPGNTTIDTAPGLSQFFVGSNERGLDPVQGVLTLQAEGTAQLFVNDRGGVNTLDRWYELSGDETGLGLDLMFTRKITAHGITNMTLATTLGRDFVTVTNTPVPTTITTGDGDDVILVNGIEAGTSIQAGLGADLFELALAGGDLAGIDGLGIDGGADGARAVASDRASLTGTRLTLSDSSLTKILLPVFTPVSTVLQQNISDWSLESGDGPDEVLIDADLTALNVATGLEKDRVVLNLNRLNGPAFVDGGSDGGSLSVDDRFSTTGQHYEFRSYLSGGAVRYAFGRSGTPGVTYSNLNGLDLAASVNDDTVTLGPVAAGLDIWLEGSKGGNTLRGWSGVNEFHITSFGNGHHLGLVESLGFSSFENLVGGASNDYFIFDTFGRLGGSMDGGGGTDVLRGPLGVNNGFEITQMNGGTLSVKDYARPMGFSSMESIVGGGSFDHFLVHPGAGVSANLDGWNGTDTLDYSLWTTSVTIDVMTRTSPGGGFTSFEYIIGGQGDDLIRGDQRPGYFNILEGGDGNDILVGGQAADTLRGGSGRDILIGGRGADLLEGGRGDDILIGNVAQYANDNAWLEAARALWIADLPIDERRVSIFPYIRSALHEDDGDADTLVGGGDLDYFFIGADDSING